MTAEGGPTGTPLVERLWWAPLAVAAVPLALGLAILAQHTWYPIGDYAQANLRLLSFWSDPPLVGAAGRIVGEGGVQGNHPGPSIFWSAWPVWWLLGRSSWAVNASVAVTDLAGAAVAVACARRLGGRRVAAAVGVVVVLLVAGYGPEVLLMPWNPSMPLMWFLALLVATWGVLLGHRGMLVVVAATASHVVQAHAGYAPIALALCALAAGAAVRHAWRSRADGGLRLLAPWVGGAVAVAALLWIPPLVDQAVSDPGNLTILLYSFGHPDESYVGLGRALQLLVLQLDPTGGLLRGAEPTSGIPLGGTVVLLVWAVSGLVARRRLARRWRTLDAVLAVALAGAWVSISRIFGLPFVYLFKWTWVIGGLLLVATGAHLLAVARSRRIGLPAGLATGALAVGLVIGLVSGLLRFGHTEVSGERYSDTVAGLIEPTTAALDPDATYLVRWRDPVALGGVGFGMLLELDRRGFDVGVDERFSAAAEPGRVLDPDDADAMISVVSGTRAIEEAAAEPGAQVVALTDPRSPRERRRFAAVSVQAARRLDELGLPDEADSLRSGGNLFAILLAHPDLPDDLVSDITEMIELFLPTAVVVSPPPA